MLENANLFYKDEDIESICIKESKFKEKPVITIGIPTYKRGAHLIDAINSALNQINCTIEYEVLVIDNDPESNIRELADMYTEYANVSLYINTRNLGMGGNWNRIIQLSKSSYVALLHDDDLLETNYLQNIEKLMPILYRKNTGALVVNRSIVGKDIYKHSTINNMLKIVISGLIDLLSIVNGRIKKLTINEVIKGWNKNYYLQPTCGTIFDRKKVIELGGWNDTYFPALDLYFFLLLNAKYDVYLYRKKLGVYRWNDNASKKIDVQIKSCVWKIKLLEQTYEDTSLNDYIINNKDMMTHVELTKYDSNVYASVVSQLSLRLNIKKTRLVVYKIQNGLYRLCKGLIY